MKIKVSLGIKILVGITFIFLFAVPGSAQDKCGIVAYTETLRSQNPARENDQSFEDWVNKKISSRKSLRTNEATKAYQIPVVVHVIHKGEAIGTGVNIPDAQIVSQIKVLNKDFKRANADSVNTPAEFQSLAGKFNVEFVLARQSPDGLATTGINRVKGSKNTWGTSDDATLKAASYWPAEDYLNIWVTDLSSTLLGYAQFPISTLSGLESAEDNRLTDGVVIDYTTFGSSDDGSFSLTTSFNKGRTATHEIGHFFGLRHIWGDVTNSCSGTDYVDDTPNQNNSTSGCPSNPQTVCSGHKMFQNYMDYTDDACMNIYTQGQVARMVTVIENSPRRVSLLASHGLEDPAPVDNDAEITSITNPSAVSCDFAIAPVLMITNKGSNSITSLSIQVKVNASVIETKQLVFSTALAVGASAEVALSSQLLTSGSYAFDFLITETNGTTDGKSSDNELTITTWIPYRADAPFTEIFSTLPASWAITNSDQLLTWALVTAPQVSSVNTAIGINYYQSTTAVGQQDIITSPVFDLSQSASPYFAFDVAYAQNSSKQDGLKVYVITDCNGISESNKVYDKTGSALATTAAQTTAFTPSGVSQWRREIIDLKNFKGYSRVQFAFVAINAQGNNLYVDNVAVINEQLENVSIKAISSPAPVRCGTTAAPVIVVQNKGTIAITSLKISYTVSGGTAQVKTTDTGFNLPVGESVSITLPQVTLATGANTLSFDLTEPNGWNDLDASDNSKQIKVVVNTAADRVPLREKFESNPDWTSVNPFGSATWVTASTNYNQSMVFDSYSNTTIGDQAWLVSPVIDFSSTSVASVFFDLSYRLKNAGDSFRGSSLDTLKVFGSSDCGNTYDQLLLSKNGVELTALEADNSWLPSAAPDWQRMYINLNSQVGQEQGRLAFVFINGNANNVYLDNIEFFESDNVSPPAVADPFLVYNSDSQTSTDFFITFNLEERQNVNYELIDLTGRSIASAQLEDVLNQTFEVGTSHLNPAVYILRLQIGGQRYARKVFVGK